ncbi:hypothetical protein KSP40_PGU018968 [Platanthera guangdongensis]|uniref:AIG1-type G domain-containing protein n=1 Tax=Platanthera guangdongensis TaxID=2320717 RepID=A0ABR2M6E9_9ASPA
MKKINISDLPHYCPRRANVTPSIPYPFFCKQSRRRLLPPIEHRIAFRLSLRFEFLSLLLCPPSKIIFRQPLQVVHQSASPFSRTSRYVKTPAVFVYPRFSLVTLLYLVNTIMAFQTAREWLGIQQFPAATQTKLIELLGKLKQENVSTLTILVMGKGGMGKSSTVNSILGERVASVNAFQRGVLPIVTGMFDEVGSEVVRKGDQASAGSRIGVAQPQANSSHELWCSEFKRKEETNYNSGLKPEDDEHKTWESCEEEDTRSGSDTTSSR